MLADSSGCSVPDDIVRSSSKSRTRNVRIVERHAAPLALWWFGTRVARVGVD